MVNQKIYTLTNGLLVGLEKDDSKIVSVKLILNTGLLDELPGDEGISHYVEHMIIRGGSKKYTQTKCDEINRSFTYNATTYSDKTEYIGSFLAEDTNLFIDYLSDTVFNPIFDNNKLEEERKRILQEISDKKGDYVFKDFKLFYDELFGKYANHNYDASLEKSVISSATVKQLKKFHKNNYLPGNSKLIIKGDFPDNIEDLIITNFGDLKGSKKKIIHQTPQNINGPRIIHTRATETESLVIKIGIPIYSDKKEEKTLIDLISYILGGAYNFESELFNSLSLKKGLVYSINVNYNNNCIFINCRTNPNNKEETIDAIFSSFEDIRTKLIPEDKLNHIKKKAKYGILLINELSKHSFEGLEDKINGDNFDENIDIINNVTPENIKETAIKFLPENKNGNYVMLLKDPLKESETNQSDYTI
ncbi:Peptidase M16 inactive domain protein [Candidatus Tiddalikarchaeum anstoanum]|nr:Peptidase M16 inactive domain protein [Candidatus Tiddalikarchaeum anstoanum]